MSTQALSAPISSLSLLRVQTQAARWKATTPQQLTSAHLYLDIAKSGYLFHDVGNAMHWITCPIGILPCGGRWIQSPSVCSAECMDQPRRSPNVAWEAKVTQPCATRIWCCAWRLCMGIVMGFDWSLSQSVIVAGGFIGNRYWGLVYDTCCKTVSTEGAI